MSFNQSNAKAYNFLSKYIPGTTSASLTFSAVSGKRLYINKIMGFDAENYDIIYPNILVSQNCATSSPTQSIYIKSSLISSNVSGKNSMTLHREPIDVEQFYFIHMSYPSNKRKIYLNYIDKITLKITDEDDHFLDFNGISWSMTMLFTKYKKLTEYELKNLRKINERAFIKEFTRELTTHISSPIITELNKIKKHIKRINKK